MRFDAATGFYLSMTRPYDPRTGDWVKPDWIGFLGGQANLSEFCGNDPTNATDPSGMAWWNAYIFDNVYEWYRGSNFDDQIRDVRIRQAQQEEARASGDRLRPRVISRKYSGLRGKCGSRRDHDCEGGACRETTAGLAATESQAARAAVGFRGRHISSGDGTVPVEAPGASGQIPIRLRARYQ